MNQLQAMRKSVREIGGDAVNLIEAMAGGFRPQISAGQLKLASWLVEGEDALVQTLSDDDLIGRIVAGEVQPSDAVAYVIALATDGVVRPEDFAEPAKIEPRGREAGLTLSRPASRVAGAGEVPPPSPVPMPKFSFARRRGVAVLHLGASRHDLTAAQLEALVPAAQLARDGLAVRQ